MSTIASTRSTDVGRRVRTGLVLTIVLGLSNIPTMFGPTPDSDNGPPYLVLLVGGLLGIVSIVAAVVAWRTGSRTAIRVCAATVIINAVLAMPAFFVDVAAGIKIISAVYMLVSVAAVVLVLARPAPSLAD